MLTEVLGIARVGFLLCIQSLTMFLAYAFCRVRPIGLADRVPMNEGIQSEDLLQRIVYRLNVWCSGKESEPLEGIITSSS